MADISKIKLGSTTYNIKDAAAARTSHTHFTTTPTSGQVVIADGTTGSIKSSGYTIATSVPSGAKFTDTVYTHPTSSGNKHIPSGGSSGQILRWSADGTAAWGADNNTWRGIQNNLTSDSTTDSLSAAQGKALKTLVDGKATSGHTHATSIATSSGTNQLTLAANTKYAITAGGTSYVFTTPPDNNTTYNFSGTAFTSNNSTGQDANNITYNAHTYYTSNGPATSLGASTNDGALYTQAYSTSWIGQIAQDYRNGGLYVRGKNNGTWQSWYRVLDTRNTTTTSIGSASGWSAGTRPSLTISSYVVGNSLNKNTSSVAGATSLTATSTTNYQSTTDYKLSIAANVTALNNSTTLGTITVGSASNWSSGTSPSLTITSVTNVRKDA